MRPFAEASVAGNVTAMRLPRSALALPILLASLPAWSQDLVSSGSGFVINEAGWIMTNGHVVDACTEVRVAGIGPAQVIHVDEISDLALVFAGPTASGSMLSFRRAPARLAEPVIAVGYPYSDILTPSVRVTDGSVSALGGIAGDRRYLQISAPLQPGNSGGPVIDMDGHVVGVASAILPDMEERPTQNVNFALDVQEALRFADGLGLRYDVSDAEDAGPARSIVDVVGEAVESVVYLTCFQGSAPARPGEVSERNPAPAQPPADDLVVRYGIDVLGHDYATLRDIDQEGCADACDRDPTCRAMTFNARHGICFLKDGATVLVNNGDAVAGLRRSALAGVIEPIVTVEANRDSPGNDLGWYDDIDFIGCVAACARNGACRAFAFVHRLDQCWLKSGLGAVVDAPGIELGWFNR